MNIESLASRHPLKFLPRRYPFGGDTGPGPDQHKMNLMPIIFSIWSRFTPYVPQTSRDTWSSTFCLLRVGLLLFEELGVNLVGSVLGSDQKCSDKWEKLVFSRKPKCPSILLEAFSSLPVRTGTTCPAGSCLPVFPSSFTSSTVPPDLSLISHPPTSSKRPNLGKGGIYQGPIFWFSWTSSISCQGGERAASDGSNPSSDSSNPCAPQGLLAHE